MAYQVWGEGPATIVAIPPFAQNIEAAWGWPDLRAMFERFGTFSRYLHFDKRGTGASDRTSRNPGIDERVDDLRAVMDHAGIGRATLFAQSDGGSTAILFAATYPGRVERLVLFGTAARPYSSAPEDHQIAMRDHIAEVWGTAASVIVDTFAPSLAANQEFRDWHQRYERQCAGAADVRDLLDLVAEMDVSEVLATLDAPTLVIHRSDELVIPIEAGRELAEAIPGARLLELDGYDHFAYVGDLTEWMPQVERFVTGRVRTPATEPMTSRDIQIATLGRFAVRRGGEEVPVSAWGSRRARQLCKRLVAARGWPVTRDELIDLLWPDEFDMRRLGARLSVQLSAVKRVLGGGVLADRQTVRLDLDAVTTDVETFYKASDDAAIVAAYSGEFLPEDRYEDWTEAVRAGIRTRFVAAARREASRYHEHGRHLEAAALGRRLIEVDPYDEPAHRLVITALAAAGEHREATRAHTSFVAAMADLGITVEPRDEPS